MILGEWCFLTRGRQWREGQRRGHYKNGLIHSNSPFRALVGMTLLATDAAARRCNEFTVCVNQAFDRELAASPNAVANPIQKTTQILAVPNPVQNEVAQIA